MYSLRNEFFANFQFEDELDCEISRAMAVFARFDSGSDELLVITQWAFSVPSAVSTTMFLLPEMDVSPILAKLVGASQRYGPTVYQIHETRKDSTTAWGVVLWRRPVTTDDDDNGHRPPPRSCRQRAPPPSQHHLGGPTPAR